MATLKITTNVGTLDLLQNAAEDFYITRQVSDLKTLQTREADYTKSIKVPATDKNLLILGSDSLSASSDSTKIPCTIELNGIMIAPIAWLLRTFDTITKGVQLLEITIFYGNFNLLDSILPGTIDQMNWADLAI